MSWRDLGRFGVVLVLSLAATALTLALLWWSVDVLLAVFAGVLLALFLGGLADWVAGRTALSRGVALTAVVVTLVVLLGVAGWFLADGLAAQFSQLIQQLPRGFSQLRDWLASREWGRLALDWLPEAQTLLSPNVAGRIAGPLATTLGTTLAVLTNVVVILFVGLYLAAMPGPYHRGLLGLVPARRRGRAEQVLQALATTLRWWLVGQLTTMTVVAVLTGFGLWLIGVPLALTLGLVAGLTSFVPYLGPILGFLPALLIALGQSATMAAWVVGLYIAVQTVESYLLTPLIQQRTVWLPPALTISAQVVLTVTLGWLGLLLATPLAAAALVLVKMLYVQSVLREPVEVTAPASDRAA